jgi:hypothetical protein
VELLHFSHLHHISLVQWTNCLLPATGDSSLCPRVGTHTLELGLPVSAVSLNDHRSMYFFLLVLFLLGLSTFFFL